MFKKKLCFQDAKKLDKKQDTEKKKKEKIERKSEKKPSTLKQNQAGLLGL